MISIDTSLPLANPYNLADKLVELINDYTEEQKNFDENDLDGLYDYLGGLISAYQTVATMIGVPHEIAYPNGDC